MSSNRLIISQSDVKIPQIITWIVTGFNMLIVSFFLIIDFSFTTLMIFIFVVVLNLAMQYWNLKVWNIWYENELLYFENIYTSKSRKISEFSHIEMVSVFRNSHTLLLSNGERYHFKIKPTDDAKLLFKMDNQFFAKQLTNILIEKKQNPY